MSARVLVTGASGMLGREVTRVLCNRGDQVIGLVRAGGISRCVFGLRTIEVDLADSLQDKLQKIGSVDAVIHLAQAPGWKSFPVGASDIADIAVHATVHLAEYACAVGARSFIYASSGGIYGPSKRPIKETAPLRPAAELGFYLSAKAAGDALVAHFASYLNVHRLRFFFIYGPHQRGEFLFPRLINSIENNKPIRIADHRGPKMNPIFVSDAAMAVLAALDSDKSLTINVAGPEVASLADIAKMLAKALNKTPIFEPTPDVPGDFAADISLMKKTIGAPKTYLKHGIAATCGVTDVV